MIRKMRMKKGQIWVETVIYTLIGLSLIGLVLAIITPRINEFKDRSIVDQTIAAFNDIDGKINEVLAAPGNVRNVEFQMKRGDISFDPAMNKIIFELSDSRSFYSEPGEEINIGRVKVLTTEGASKHTITLTMDYVHDLTYEGDDTQIKQFSAANVPYKFSIENLGFNAGSQIIINIREVS
jgi:type II secretory pathway pseudopilin PulG